MERPSSKHVGSWAAGGALTLLLGSLAAPAWAERDWSDIAPEPEATTPGQVAARAPAAAQRPTFDLNGARLLLRPEPRTLLAAAAVSDSELAPRDRLFQASGDVQRLTEENFADPDVRLGPQPGAEPESMTEPPAEASDPALPHESTPDSDVVLEDEALDDEALNDGALDIEGLEEDFDDFEDGIVEVPAASDPLEVINRPIFEANLFLDRWVLRPVTRVYIETVPEPGRNGLANALDNLRTPVILLNDLFQGEMSRAGATFGRFFINSLLGLGGAIDVADAMGLPGHEEDFGQTLGSYGVGGSPYLMLPFLGPSNPRDAVGRVTDIVIDPLTYLTPESLSEIETGVGLVSDRAEVIDETDVLEATSVDYYAAVRSFYYQNRNYEISNGRTEPVSLPGPDDALDRPAVEEMDLGDEEELRSLEEDLDVL